MQKILESLKWSHSSYEGLIYWRKSFIQFLLMLLWPRNRMVDLVFQCMSSQRLLHTWTDSLGTFFKTFAIMIFSKSDSNIIWRSSKNITFPKIWRVWLKNWVRHAHFNFELPKGVAVLFSELCPSNFGQS